MKSAVFIGCVTVGILTGCSTLPSAGPTSSEIFEQAEKQPRRFELVEIDPRVVSVLAAQAKPNLQSKLEAFGKPPARMIAPGDKLSISVWRMQTAPENPTGEGGGALVIPDQTVGDDGAISVPYAGRVQAVGRSPVQVQKEIQQRSVSRQLLLLLLLLLGSPHHPPAAANRHLHHQVLQRQQVNRVLLLLPLLLTLVKKETQDIYLSTLDRPR